MSSSRFDQRDVVFMRAALELSLEGVRGGLGGPFGAVIVRDDAIVGRGCNRVTSSNDPTAHAEISAIRDACATLETFRLVGCALFSSCEPCPMCLSAAHWARLDRIVYAASRTDASDSGFDDQLIHDELALEASGRRLPVSQICREEALAAFREWDAKPDKVPY